ncbi:MAG: response regulator [Gammaproteobacteria bacterium]|jgi:diguanylate cyclase (GGDEF)-like protein
MSEKKEENQRLLIVDDSRVIRVTARKILRDHFETVEAVDGENAWEILSSEATFSLVVSDLTMPNLDGFGLLKRIRNSHLPHVRDLPVIIITGANDTEATMEQAREAGATDFIGKPFDAIHLLARTQAYADSHTLTTTLRQENTSLEEQSAIDPLTGLSNETVFMERGYQQLSYAIRNGSSLGIFRIEIDDYGKLFREHGAKLAETVVCAMADTLTAAIRQEDTAARTGTARFSLLLPGMNLPGIRALGKRISAEFSTRSFTTGDTRLRTSVSIGAGLPEIGKDTRLDELLAIADRRLLQASKAGGNRIILDDTTAVAETTAVRVTAAEPAVFPFEDESLEVEEIELFAAGYPFDIFSNNNKPRTAKDRSADTPGSAAETAADPRADNVVEITNLAEATATTPAHAKANAEKARFHAADVSGDGELSPAVTLAAQPAEDDIAISAPFAADPESNSEAIAAGEQHCRVYPGDAASGDEDTDNDRNTADTVTRRPGLLKRAFALFRRAR